jgi:protein-S-isoprenylcysteine O-methyltransferase Ste14
MAFVCNDVSGCPAPSLLHPSTLTLEKLKNDFGWHGISTIFTWEAFIANLGWYLLSLILYAALPAQEVDGTMLRSGGRLKYRLNGNVYLNLRKFCGLQHVAFASAMFTFAIAVAGTLLQGADFPVWTFIWDNFIPLLTANLILSFALACYVYAKSFSVKPGALKTRELSQHGATGNLIYDWFIGRELNPRVTLPLIGEVDIKSWMEMRPGLTGWALIDCAMIAHQYKNYGFVSDSILIIVVAQVWYVFDAFYMEPAILTTIDIISDGFGFMLSYGDVAWLPFIYSLQARYLAVHPVVLGWYNLLVFGFLGVGYYIFRSTNNEKNRFRTNPKDPKIAHLKYMQTKAGSKLLISGWWGRARHINYLGDWILSWSYCLPTGIAGYVVLQNSKQGAPVVEPGEARGWGMLITYFYMLYFAVLLVHRQIRDEEKCRAKYGADWDEYCKKVPYRIVPYIY